MPTTAKATIINWFKRGLKPLETQFAAWLDSYWHKDEGIPIASVTNLQTVLNGIQTLHLAGPSDVSVNPVVLNSANYIDILFVASDTISSNKTLSFTNDDNARRKRFLLRISGTPVLTLPGNCKMVPWQSGWTDAGKTLDFTQIGEGDFELEFVWDSVREFYQTKLTGGY